MNNSEKKNKEKKKLKKKKAKIYNKENINGLNGKF